MKHYILILSRKLGPQRARQRGFTLIELLVVVGIIALLAGLVVSVSSRVVANANREQTLNNQKIILTAIERYGDVAKTFPVSSTGTGTARVPPGKPTVDVFTDPDIPSSLKTAPPQLTTDYARSGWLLLQYLSGRAAFEGKTSSSITDQQIARLRSQTGEVLLKLPAEVMEIDNSSTPAVGVGFHDACTNSYMAYDCSGGLGGRPVIISAGPDGQFGTSDDVRSDDR